MNTQHGHFGIIPDGGRRWARREGKSLMEAYSTSVPRILELATMAYHCGFNEVSVYCLSLSNLERPQAEVEAVFDTFRGCLHLVEDFIGGNTFKNVRVVGEIDRLPKDLQERMSALKRDSIGPVLNLLVAYDSWAELRRAQQRAVGAPVELQHFDVKTPLQVIFRTAEGTLLSGFLPFQSQYAHLIVSDRLFNDLSIEDMRRALEASDHLDHWFGR